MITVERTLSPMGIKITGHAGSAEYGKDLVCASASILFYTLSESALELSRNGKCYQYTQDIPGDSYVKIEPIGGNDVECEKVIGVIMNGFRLLSDAYPDYVRLI